MIKHRTKKQVRKEISRKPIANKRFRFIVSSLNNLQESDRRFMALAIYTGMRKGELIGLRWEDIDIGGNVIHVSRSANVNKGKAILGEPKTESGKRDIPIAPELLKYLVPLKATGFVVVGVRDSSGVEPISGTTYNLMIERINKAINLHDATAHVFRHTMGTLLYDAEQNVKTVQAIMGHSDYKTTADRYVHAVDSRKQEAMNKVSDVLAFSWRKVVLPK